MVLRIELDQEEDGRWIAEVVDIPGALFAFHDREEIGPKMLAKIAKKTGLRPEDL